MQNQSSISSSTRASSIKAQADDALQEIGTSGKDVVQTLTDFGLVTEEEFYQHIAESLGTDVVDLTGFEPPPEVVRLVQAGLARLHGAVPISASGDTITVCLTDPLNPQIAEDLRFALGKEYPGRRRASAADRGADPEKLWHGRCQPE